MIKYEVFNINNFSETDYNRFFSLMADSKKEKTEKYRFSADKKLSVAGDMLARKMISEKCRISQEEILFSVHNNGKPYVLNCDIHFSISHSGSLAVCAISDKPIGADIEFMAENDFSAAEIFATDKEKAYIFDESISDTERKERFYSVWTYKESYSKMLGAGLKMDFKNIDYFEKKNFIHKIFDSYCLTITEKE